MSIDITADTEWVEIHPEDGKAGDTARALLDAAGDQPEIVRTSMGPTAFLVPAELADRVEARLSELGADIDGAGDVDGTGQGKPAGNASTDEWYAYAKSQGASDDDLKDLGRDDIRALFPG